MTRQRYTVTVPAYYGDAHREQASRYQMNEPNSANNETLPNTDWQSQNFRGLECACEGDWLSAVGMFTLAQQSLAVADFDDEAERDGANAVLGSNLAAARFHSGDLQGALEEAQASLILREQLWGDTLATARVASDCATVCAALGRFDDARGYITQAIETAEACCGEDAAELVTFVENAAQLEIAAGNYGAAEPFVLRLHGLLDSAGLAVTPAVELFTRIIESRNGTTAGATQESGSDAGEAFDDNDGLTLESADPPVENAYAETTALPTPDVFDGFGELELSEVENSEPTGAVADLEAYATSDDQVDNGIDEILGFAVEYDMLHDPVTVGEDQTVAEPHSEFAEEAGIDELSRTPGDVQEEPAASETTALPAESQEFTRPTQTRGVLPNHRSREIPVVLPSPSQSHRAVGDDDEEEDTPRNSVFVTGSSTAVKTHSRPRKVLLDRPRARVSGGARVWLIVGGGITAVAIAVAWFVLQNPR